MDQKVTIFDIHDMKEKLKEYMKVVEDNQTNFSFRFEARYIIIIIAIQRLLNFRFCEF